MLKNNISIIFAGLFIYFSLLFIRPVFAAAPPPKTPPASTKPCYSSSPSFSSGTYDAANQTLTLKLAAPDPSSGGSDFSNLTNINGNTLNLTSSAASFNGGLATYVYDLSGNNFLSLRNSLTQNNQTTVNTSEVLKEVVSSGNNESLCQVGTNGSTDISGQSNITIVNQPNGSGNPQATATSTAQASGQTGAQASQQQGPGTCTWNGSFTYESVGDANKCNAGYIPAPNPSDNPLTGQSCICQPVASKASFTPSPCNPSASIGDGSRCLTPGGITCDPVSGAKDDIPNSAHQGIYSAIGCIPTSPDTLISGLLTFSARIGGGIALLLMIFGAIGMITSAGNEEALKGAKSRFTSAAIGLLFVIFATVLLKIIGVSILNLPGFG